MFKKELAGTTIHSLIIIYTLILTRTLYITRSFLVFSDNLYAGKNTNIVFQIVCPFHNTISKNMFLGRAGLPNHAFTPERLSNNVVEHEPKFSKQFACPTNCFHMIRRAQQLSKPPCLCHIRFPITFRRTTKVRDTLSSFGTKFQSKNEFVKYCISC